MMTVKELIEELNKIEDKDLPIWVSDNCGGGYALQGESFEVSEDKYGKILYID